MKVLLFLTLIFSAILFAACAEAGQEEGDMQNAQNDAPREEGAVRLMTLDPGHFHAALVQKSMYDQVDPTVHVFAPEGPDVEGHLALIESYNTRSDNPTRWEEQVYYGDDFFEKMLADKPGNVVVLSGNNAKKTEYIREAIEAGLHVYADKPMAITPEDFPVLEEAFQAASEKGVLLYDIMTERFEITTIIQRELSKVPEIFGELTEGTVDEPAITKESVHHFFKYVSGEPIKRPAWFFDTNQQGEGIVDVTTHLVDLIQWEAFPEQTLSKSDVQIIAARRWPTVLTPEQFEKVTQLSDYPDYLQQAVSGENLNVFANGEIIYRLKDKIAKVTVIWNFEAPEGAGDTHYSIMRGTRSNLIIEQGEEEGYIPMLYVEANQAEDAASFEQNLEKTITQDLAAAYPGLTLTRLNDRLWRVEIPDRYRVGHEAHFGQVTERFLEYLENGNMPAWEVPNMITKYYTTTEALRLALQEQS